MGQQSLYDFSKQQIYHGTYKSNIDFPFYPHISSVWTKDSQWAGNYSYLNTYADNQENYFHPNTCSDHHCPTQIIWYALY